MEQPEHKLAHRDASIVGVALPATSQYQPSIKHHNILIVQRHEMTLMRSFSGRIKMTVSADEVCKFS